MDGEICFIGTATVLIRCCGFTILTDPNFLHRGERAYVGMGLSTKRLTEPAIDIKDLPDLDLVVLSHHHGDHFDRRAAAGLRKDLPIITEPHAARKLERQGFTEAVALQTWQTWSRDSPAGHLKVTSVPGKHAPFPLDRVVPPVMGSVLDFADGSGARTRIYITGDTLCYDQLEEIPKRFPQVDLCLIHLGGTRIAGVLLTMDATQGVEALRIIAPCQAIPIHYDDYTLFKSPLSDFRRAVAADNRLATEIVYLERGDSHHFELAAHGARNPFPDG